MTYNKLLSLEPSCIVVAAYPTLEVLLLPLVLSVTQSGEGTRCRRLLVVSLGLPHAHACPEALCLTEAAEELLRLDLLLDAVQCRQIYTR